MLTLYVLITFCLFILPGCIPLYLAGARMAVSTVAGIASGVAAAGASQGAEVPKERSVLFEQYRQCLQQREMNPVEVDCARYRAAFEATTE